MNTITIKLISGLSSKFKIPTGEIIIEASEGMLLDDVIKKSGLPEHLGNEELLVLFDGQTGPLEKVRYEFIVNPGERVVLYRMAPGG